MNVKEKAESLGATIIAAPNAMYASGFPNQEAISIFTDWLDNNEFSHGDAIAMIGSRKGQYDIRYEK